MNIKDPDDLVVCCASNHVMLNELRSGLLDYCYDPNLIFKNPDECIGVLERSSLNIYFFLDEFDLMNFHEDMISIANRVLYASSSVSNNIDLSNENTLIGYLLWANNNKYNRYSSNIDI